LRFVEHWFLKGVKEENTFLGKKPGERKKQGTDGGMTNVRRITKQEKKG
jgi:hypothetical protein